MAVNSVDLAVNNQEFVVLMGPSGCFNITLINRPGLMPEKVGVNVSV